MITSINTPKDCIAALNENFAALVTKDASKKRTLPMAKEINITIGRIMDVHKLEAVSKNLCKDNTPLSWFDEPKVIGMGSEIKSITAKKSR